MISSLTEAILNADKNYPDINGKIYTPWESRYSATMADLKKTITKIYKVMPWFGIGKKAVETARRVYDQFVEEFGDEYEIAYSGPAIEMMEKGTNKADSLKKLLDICNIGYDEVAVVGDSGNDIPLFENFENSFVMPQAPEEVKQKAKVRLKAYEDLANYID